MFRNSGKLGPANSMKQDNFFELTLKTEGGAGVDGEEEINYY